MKLLVLSDSHGCGQFVQAILQKNADADVIIHLGDGLPGDLDCIKSLPGMEKKRIITLRGNCDSDPNLPVTSFDNIGGFRFYCTHGYRQHVKYGVEYLLKDARDHDRNVVLFGHTHSPYFSQFGDTYLFNPGAVLDFEVRYGIITIENSEICFSHQKMGAELRTAHTL